MHNAQCGMHVCGNIVCVYMYVFVAALLLSAISLKSPSDAGAAAVAAVVSVRFTEVT